MASYQTLVQAVHEVYKAEGGQYSEGTAPRLIEVASQLFEAIEADLRTHPDKVEVVARIYYDDIVRIIRENA